MTKLERQYQAACDELDRVCARRDVGPLTRRALLFSAAEKAVRAAYPFHKKKCPPRYRVTRMAAEVVRRLLKIKC